MNNLFSQLFRFGTVGFFAATIHFVTVLLLVQNFFLSPLIANAFAFMIAFQVSYWGHKRWTFQQTTRFSGMTFSKLLVVQVINFFANETLFYLFLSLSLPYPLALFIVLTVLPFFTFLSSKWWVFKA